MMLKKLMKKMPSKSDDMGLDIEELKSMEDMESPEDEAMESPEEQAMEDELGIEKHKKPEGKALDLEGISDDELMAELKKRGLLGKMEEKGEEESEDMYV